MIEPPAAAIIREAAARALGEDRGPADITTLACVKFETQSSARIFAKESCVLAGLPVAEQVFREQDPLLVLTAKAADGDSIAANQTVLEITGSAASILTAERCALNFIQQLSGVATQTHRFVEATTGTKAKILDTRKTIPGLRALQKYAVRCGGGTNHRFGLYDRFLIKDNHLALMGEGNRLSEAIRAARALDSEALLEVEVDRIDPENRPFTHADPVAWTLDNRGTILRALYTILLANQQLQPGKQHERKTRFKMWWHLVGSAVENAAAELVEQQSTAAPDLDRYAELVDFAKLFASVEGDDEEGAALGDILSILDRKWPGVRFEAIEVATYAGEDHDDAKTLRQFFEQNSRQSGAPVSSRTVGKRLMTMVGAPVPAGDYTLMLTRVNDDDATNSKKRASRFKVKRL